MYNNEQYLVLMMRAFGGISLLALPFVFVPRSWMGAIHERLLRLGKLPAEPIVGYLARSTSAFYAILGGLMILFSTDVTLYRAPIFYLLVCELVFGCVLFGVDIAERLPLAWILIEGPSIIFITAVMLMLM